MNSSGVKWKAGAVEKSYHQVLGHLVNHHLARSSKIAWFQFSPGLPNWTTWTFVTWLKSQKSSPGSDDDKASSIANALSLSLFKKSQKQLQDAYWHVGSKWRKKCWKYCSKSFLFKRRPKSFRLARAALWQSGPCSPRSGTNKHIYLPYITYISPTRN